MPHPLWSRISRVWRAFFPDAPDLGATLSPFSVNRLEDRITPTGPAFEYRFSEAALKSIVVVHGDPSQAPYTARAERLDSTGQWAVADILAPPDPILGVGQGYWWVEVVVFPGWRPIAVHSPVLNYDGSVYNNQTLTEKVQPSNYATLASLCGPFVAQSPAGQTAPGNRNHQSTSDTISPAGIGYYDGRVNYEEADASSDALAGPFGQSRSWGWGTGLDYGQRVGNGWVNRSLPTTRKLNSGNMRFVNGVQGGALEFKAGAGVWVPTFDSRATLTVDTGTGEVILTDELGNVTVFYDEVPGVTPFGREGQMKRHTDRSGVVTEVVSWTADGAPAEVRRTGGAVVESWVYGYGSGVSSDLTTSVQFRRSTDGGVTFQSVQAVEYGYYGLGNANGNLNDLRSVVIRSGGTSGPVERTSYYRYYTPFDPNGFQGQLKSVITDTDYDRLAAAFGTSLASVDSLSDSQLGVYAGRRYKYDSSGKAIEVVAQGQGCSVCSAGQGVYAYTYGRNPHRPYPDPDGSAASEQNVWHAVTQETLPDGNSNRVYTNPGGQVMLRVYTEGATGQQWRWFTQFDAQGRLLRTADPVAVTGWDEQYDDLLHLVGGNYQYLSDFGGVVTEYVYGAGTTATATNPGDVTGYLRLTQLRHGEFGNQAIPLLYQKYWLRSAGGLTIYPLADVTRFPNAPSTTPLYTDDFSSASPNVAWGFQGTGTWQQSGGVLSQSRINDVSVFKQAHVTGQTWDPTQEIVASIRIDSWAVAGAPWAAAGVGVRGDANTGRGYSLVFRTPGKVDLWDNFAGGTAQANFTWQVGVWYRVRVRIEGDILYGKVWDASQPEPLGWMVSVDVVAAGWTPRAGGNPHLLGGMSWGPGESMTASFDDVRVECVALPPGETTRYSYTWSATAPLFAASMTVTFQNPRGYVYLPIQVTTVYDAAGRPVWVKDQLGYLSYTAYDAATGAVVRSIADVNTSLTADFADLPYGWATPTGGGAHVKTVLAVDGFGRITSTVRPSGAVDHFTYDDATESAKTYSGWTGTTTTGPVQLTRRDRAGGDVTVGGQTYRYTYVESLTYAPASIPVDGAGRPTGAEAVSNIRSLVREYFNQAGQMVWKDEYFSLTGLSYLDGSGKPVFALGTEGVHFLRTRYDYDKHGRPNRVQGPSGTISRTVYDGQGRVVSTWRGDNDTPTSGYWSPSNPAGMVQTAAYEYDGGGVGAGNLTLLTLMPGGGAADRVTVMAYDWRNRLVAVKEGAGGIEYGGVNRPLTYFDVDNLGRVTRTRTYDGDATWVTDADGDGVPDAPAAGLLRGLSETFYDSLGQVYRTSTTAVDQTTGAVSATQDVTDTWYDDRGLVVKVKRPGGLVTKWNYDGLGRVTAAYTTDGGGDSSWDDALTLTGDTVFAQSETAYDADGHVIQVTTRERWDGQTGTGLLQDMTTGTRARVSYAGWYYDAAGRLTAAVDVGTNGGTAWTRPGSVPARSDTELVTSYAYDDAGRVADVTDPMGYVDHTAYDLLGRVTLAVVGYGTTEAQTTGVTYDSGGRVLDVTAPGGSVSRTGYDSFGRQSSFTRAFGTALARTVTTGYNNLDEVVSVVTPFGPTSSPGTVTTSHEYDPVGRPVSVTEASGTALERTTTYGYDVLGRQTSVTRPGSQTWTTTYDDVLRKVTAADPQGFARTTTFDAAGNAVSVTDPLVHATTYAYDLQNRLVSATDPTTAATTFQYTVTGGRDSVTDARGNVTDTIFDRFGRTAGTVDPFGKSTTYAYDRDSRLVSVTDRLGRERAFAYNAVGQRTAETWYPAGGGAAVQTQVFTYDAAGNLTGASDPDGSYTLAYDALNRPTTVSGPFSFGLTFTYDAAGHRATATDTQGGVQTSKFDELGRLKTRTLDTATADVRVDYTYTARGMVDTVQRWSDLAGTTSAGATNFGYDTSDRLTGITHRKADTSVIAAYSYGLDAAGRLTSRTEGGSPQTFTYNDRNEVTGDAGTGYTYDATGNRTNTGYTTSTVGNRLESDGTWSYTYDDEGQLTKKSQGASAETWTYGYDHRGQMVWAERRATDGGTLLGRVEYSYDAFGNRIRRVAKDGSGTVTSDERYAQDGWDTAKPGAVGSENFDVWADLDGSNAVTTRRVYGAEFDEPVARVAAGGATAWYLTDRQGSVRLVINNSGTTIGSRDFTAFGAVTAESGTGLDRYAYTAREWDSTLSLQYSRMRMYDPAVGRFTREDPLGLSAGDPNLHRYAGNAVTTYSDPSGLAGTPDPLGSVGHGALEVYAGVVPGLLEIPYLGHDVLAAICSRVTGNPPDYWSAYAKGMMEYEANGGNRWEYALKAASNAASFGLTGLIDQLATAKAYADATGDSSKLFETMGAGLAHLSMWWVGSKAASPSRSAISTKAMAAAKADAEVVWKVGRAGGEAVGEGAAVRAAAEEMHPTGRPSDNKLTSGQVEQRASCFPAGTPVHVGGGLKPIEAIEKGDRVWAFDHRRACWTERVVVDAYIINHDGSMATVTVAGETIRATGGHPYWVVRGEDLGKRTKPLRIPAYEAGSKVEGRWVLAQDLRIGDVVLQRGVGEAVVEGVSVTETREVVYNFTVADLQNYAIGERGVLVHNTNDPTGYKRATAEYEAAMGRWEEAHANGNTAAAAIAYEEALEAAGNMARIEAEQAAIRPPVPPAPTPPPATTATAYHYTSREGYNGMNSTRRIEARVSGYSEHGVDGPVVFVTPWSPETVATRGVKTLGLTREKAQYVVPIDVPLDQIQRIPGGRGEYIWYVPGDVALPPRGVIGRPTGL